MATLRLGRLLLATLLALGVTASLAAAADPSGDFFAAEGGSWFRRIFGTLNSRARIIQFCVAMMCLGLFILIKKFAPLDLPAGKNPGTDVPGSPDVPDSPSSRDDN
jgi:hypothetical protein